MGNLAVGAYTAAMVFGMLGDDQERSRWIEITTALLSHPDRLFTYNNVWRTVFDGMLALHRGDLTGAAEVLASYSTDPAERVTVDVLWGSWHAALRAETAVLTGEPDVIDVLLRAREQCLTNDIALAIVDRAAALQGGRIDELAAIADRLTLLGCSYQADRTRALAHR